MSVAGNWNNPSGGACRQNSSRLTDKGIIPFLVVRVLQDSLTLRLVSIPSYFVQISYETCLSLEMTHHRS